jgi:hypothetical protein
MLGPSRRVARRTARRHTGGRGVAAPVAVAAVGVATRGRRVSRRTARRVSRRY